MVYTGASLAPVALSVIIDFYFISDVRCHHRVRLVVDDPLTEGEKIVCHEKLGGLLRHYERVAA